METSSIFLPHLVQKGLTDTESTFSNWSFNSLEGRDVIC